MFCRWWDIAGKGGGLFRIEERRKTAVSVTVAGGGMSGRVGRVGRD